MVSFNAWNSTSEGDKMIYRMDNGIVYQITEHEKKPILLTKGELMRGKERYEEWLSEEHEW